MTAPQKAWPRAAQLAAAFLLGIGGALLAVRLVASPPRPLELERASFDLNRLDRAQLMQLPTVGPALADRIVTARDARGGLNGVEDLRDVPGVGPARMERLRPLLGGTTAAPPSVSAKLTQPIDVNSAGLDALQSLPGIGAKMAQRIVDERQKSPFQSVDDLRRVFGIGAKTLEKLRPLVVAGPPLSAAR